LERIPAAAAAPKKQQGQQNGHQRREAGMLLLRRRPAAAWLPCSAALLYQVGRAAVHAPAWVSPAGMPSSPLAALWLTACMCARWCECCKGR
jgi:hypothetical protein